MPDAPVSHIRFDPGMIADQAPCPPRAEFVIRRRLLLCLVGDVVLRSWRALPHRPAKEFSATATVSEKYSCETGADEPSVVRRTPLAPTRLCLGTSRHRNDGCDSLSKRTMPIIFLLGCAGHRCRSKMSSDDKARAGRTRIDGHQIRYLILWHVCSLMGYNRSLSCINIKGYPLY